jgi:phospholipase/carboxylesterase
LAPIAAELDVPTAVRWLFPDGPLPITDFPDGRAWWQLDQDRLMRAQLGEPYDLSGSRPAGLDDAIRSAEEFLAAIDVPRERLILGGFSQGAMLALELALRGSTLPKGLFLLSSTLVDEANVRRLAPNLSGLKVFQSHGEQDPLLPYGAARRLHDILGESGLILRFASFAGGHSLPREALERFQGYLGDVLS